MPAGAANVIEGKLNNYEYKSSTNLNKNIFQ